MDILQFNENKTGIVVPIVVREGLTDHAFVPAMLPYSWAARESLWPLIVEARDRVASLNGAGSILPNPALLLRPLQRREAIRSNSIEGTYVSPEELLLFEAAPLETKDERNKDWLEVLLYDRALGRGCNAIGEGAALDRQLICELHRILVGSSRGKDKNPGTFRDTQVYIESGRRYIPPPAANIEGLFSNLEEYMASAAEIDPLVRAFITHYQFEAIHPFKDGNGRMGRLLLSLTIFKWLKHAHAWLYLSEFFDRHRKEYLARLFAVSTEGAWDEWVEFCLRGTIEQAEAAVVRCRRLEQIKRDYDAKVGHSRRMNRIITLLLCNPIVDIPELAKSLGVSYNTARGDVEKLIASDILRPLATRQPRSFYAQEIFEIAYGD